jgi:hypothetical protein
MCGCRRSYLCYQCDSIGYDSENKCEFSNQLFDHKINLVCSLKNTEEWVTIREMAVFFFGLLFRN